MWSLPRSCALLAIGWIGILLTACAQQDRVAAFQTQAGTISLQRSHGDGAFVVTVTPNTVLPLSGYTKARIESTWDATSGRLIVIAGASANCPLRYTLLVVTRSTASAVPIGECGETYNFSQEAGTFAAKQADAREAKVWIFRDGSLYGPIIQRARIVRSTRREQPPRPADTPADPTSLPSISVPVGEEVVPTPVAPPGSAPSTRSHDTSHF